MIDPDPGAIAHAVGVALIHIFTAAPLVWISITAAAICAGGVASEMLEKRRGWIAAAWAVGAVSLFAFAAAFG